MIEIESERLHFRMWKESDFETYAAYYTNPELARFVGGTMTREEAWRKMASAIGHWHLKGFGHWAIDEKETGDFVGCVGLWKSDGWPEMELGYWIMKNKQGMGYATEAAKRCREYAFQVLKTPSLVSYIDPGNEASKKVAERVGATYEKTMELLDFGAHCVYRHSE